MKPQLTFQSILFITTLILCSLSVATASTQDPLSANEQAKALTLIESSKPMLKLQPEASHSFGSYELLLIERDRSEDKTSAARHISAFIYNYKTDETLIYRIDPVTNKILSLVSRKNMQLPLTANEIERTVNLIFADKETFKLIKNEYQRITGKVLNSPKALEAKAFVFTADTLPEHLNIASQQCGFHRCAQILLYTHDSVVFEISPIVNLSANLITQIVGF